MSGEKLPPPITDGAYLTDASAQTAALAPTNGSPASTVVGSNGSDEKAAYKEEKAYDDEEADRIKRQNSKVDVEGAEQQFATIRRQLSEASAIRRRTTKGSSVSDQDNEELGLNDECVRTPRATYFTTQTSAASTSSPTCAPKKPLESTPASLTRSWE